MNNVNLAKTAEVLCTLGKHLALYGAETRLIVQSVKEMAADLGLLKIDLALTRTGITVKIIKGQAKVIEFAEITSFGINMSALTSLHQICLEVKEGKLKDPEEILLAINAVKAGSYDKSLLILIEAVAASAFAFLNGGNLEMQRMNTGLAGFKTSGVKGLDRLFSESAKEMHRGLSHYVEV